MKRNRLFFLFLLSIMSISILGVNAETKTEVAFNEDLTIAWGYLYQINRETPAKDTTVFVTIASSQLINFFVADEGDTDVYINGGSIFVYVDDSVLGIPGYDNTLTFYYNFTNQLWRAYLNYDDIDNPFNPKLNISGMGVEYYDPNSFDIQPRIETFYSYELFAPKGILVTLIDSHYYKRVRNKYDFEVYKNFYIIHL